MIAESAVFALLSPLCGGRCFPDVAPLDTARPYVTYQRIGGDTLNYTDKSLPDNEHAEFQVNVFADTRLQASALATQIETAFIGAATFNAEPASRPVADYDHDFARYISRQDFSIWSARG